MEPGRNHPSVVPWSLRRTSPSTTDRAAYRTWISQLRATATSIDPSSGQSRGLHRPVGTPPSTLADDHRASSSTSAYFYGHDGDLGCTLDAVRRQYPRSPILITENGSYADPGRHGSPGRRPAPRNGRQTSSASTGGKMTARADQLAGYTYWLLKDYKQRRK